MNGWKEPSAAETGGKIYWDIVAVAIVLGREWSRFDPSFREEARAGNSLYLHACR